ncbi:hypothetical protein SLS57_003761 [Botryosphaeria dothidea]
MSDVGDSEGSQSDDDASINAQDAPEERTDFSAHEGDNEISGPDSALRLQPKKRKKSFNSENTKAKRLKGLYRDEYRRFYNSTIADFSSFNPDGNTGRLESSQIGASTWTVPEKHRLFSAVDRYGKDDMPRITAIVRTKSEPEVREFLLLLQDAVVELHINSDDVSKTTASHEIPAACEISEECCRSLEAAADALASHQDSWDVKQEQKRHGKYWLLTPDMADLFDKALEENHGDDRLTDDDQGYSTSEPAPGGDSDEEEEERDVEHAQDALDAVPAARLLRLSKWLELSRSVFANAGGAREAENWRSIAEPGEHISIFHSAFSDLHRLAVSVTQRLVAASLSQATSRLRAWEDTGDRAAGRPIVRRDDVLTALEMLNMPRSAKQFWVKAPRRCGVVVQQHQNIINYEEVERILRGQPAFNSAAAPTQEIVMQDGHTADDAQATEHITSDTETDSDLDNPDVKQETYAELFDVQQSHQEEERLWQLLGQDVMPAITMELPKRPHLSRKTGDELIEWRNVIDFKAEWERYGKPIESARPVDVNASAFASVNRGFETARSPSPLLKRAETSALDIDQTSHASSGDVEEPPQDIASPITEEGEEDGSDASEPSGSLPGGTHPSTLPIRRVLAPRRARDAATSSMGELPPYPEMDDSSGDNYDGRSE